MSLARRHGRVLPAQVTSPPFRSGRSPFGRCGLARRDARLRYLGGYALWRSTPAQVTRQSAPFLVVVCARALVGVSLARFWVEWSCPPGWFLGGVCPRLGVWLAVGGGLAGEVGLSCPPGQLPCVFVGGLGFVRVPARLSGRGVVAPGWCAGLVLSKVRVWLPAGAKTCLWVGWGVCVTANLPTD